MNKGSIIPGLGVGGGGCATTAVTQDFIQRKHCRYVFIYKTLMVHDETILRVFEGHKIRCDLMLWLGVWVWFLNWSVYLYTFTNKFNLYPPNESMNMVCKQMYITHSSKNCCPWGWMCIVYLSFFTFIIKVWEVIMQILIVE